MIPRYVVCASWISDWDGIPTQPVAETVYASPDDPIDTGLVNVEGFRLLRRPEPRPIGFDLRPRSERSQP